MSQPSPATPVDLVEMLGQHVEQRPHAPCLIFEDESISFSEFGERTDRLASALRSEGVSAGDRVAILANASPVFFELLFACAKAGAIFVPINSRLSAREVAEIISDAGPGLIFLGADHAALVPDDPRARVIRLENFPAWRDKATAATRQLPVRLDDPVLILYTSGTTAQPKGVVLSHRNLAYLGRMARELWNFTAESTNLAAMPLFHIGGIGWGLLAFSQGGRTVVTQATTPAALLDLMGRYRVTHTFFVPTVIQRLVDHLASSGQEAPRVDHMFYGAAPMGEVLLRLSINAFGCKFHHTYGMTETAGTVVTLAPGEHDPDGPNPERLRSCGRAMPWVELKLVNPATGEDVPPGEIGEIWMRSPAISKGYWRKPKATEEAITPDGWLRSGDAAEQDALGFIYLRDRYKNMIVSGGENIYPAEIDNVLQHHPAIQEVAVVGVPHSKWGETPCAYVVLRPGKSATASEIIGFARDRLAHYKCPTSVVFTADLPRNASGKILKRELRG